VSLPTLTRARVAPRLGRRGRRRPLQLDRTRVVLERRLALQATSAKKKGRAMNRRANMG